MAFTVGQLAKLTGLTVRALHHYDAIGLLVPSNRSDAGYRLYTQADTARLFQIQALRRLGLSLPEINEVLTKNGASLPEIVTQQVEELNDRIEQTTALRARLLQLRDLLVNGRAWCQRLGGSGGAHYALRPVLLVRGDEPAAGPWQDADR
jgi:MerR family transcriptional regulator, thiopeptide resistance regulator